MEPTKLEVVNWFRDVARHSSHVEFYLAQTGINPGPEERPHDISGIGNKLTWPVTSGLAVAKREGIDFKRDVLPSIEYHRKQKHHRMWNEPNSEATPNDMRYGAVDAICSMLENRGYQGGTHDFDEIAKVIESDRSPEHSKPWMREVLFVMRDLPRPDLEQITDIVRIPNIGVPADVHKNIVSHFDLAKSGLLQVKHYSPNTFASSYAAV